MKFQGPWTRGRVVLLMQLASILNMLRSRDTFDKEEKYKTILEFHDSSAWDIGACPVSAKSCGASRPALGVE